MSRQARAHENFKDYYEILGVTRNATRTQIIKAYRGLALKHHPDKTPRTLISYHQPMFQNISSAYEALKSGTERTAYDTMLASFENKTSYLTPEGDLRPITEEEVQLKVPSKTILYNCHKESIDRNARQCEEIDETTTARAHEAESKIKSAHKAVSKVENLVLTAQGDNIQQLADAKAQLEMATASINNVREIFNEISAKHKEINDIYAAARTSLAEIPDDTTEAEIARGTTLEKILPLVDKTGELYRFAIDANTDAGQISIKIAELQAKIQELETAHSSVATEAKSPAEPMTKPEPTPPSAAREGATVSTPPANPAVIGRKEAQQYNALINAKTANVKFLKNSIQTKAGDAESEAKNAESVLGKARSLIATVQQRVDEHFIDPNMQLLQQAKNQLEEATASIAQSEIKCGDIGTHKSDASNSFEAAYAAFDKIPDRIALAETARKTIEKDLRPDFESIMQDYQKTADIKDKTKIMSGEIETLKAEIQRLEDAQRTITAEAKTIVSTDAPEPAQPAPYAEPVAEPEPEPEPAPEQNPAREEPSSDDQLAVTAYTRPLPEHKPESPARATTATRTANASARESVASAFFRARLKQPAAIPRPIQVNIPSEIMQVIIAQSQHAEALQLAAKIGADVERAQHTAAKANKPPATQDQPQQPARTNTEGQNTQPAATSSDIHDKFDKTDPDPFTMGKKEYEDFVKKQDKELAFYQTHKPKEKTVPVEINGTEKQIKVLDLPFHDKDTAHKFLDDYKQKHPEQADLIDKLNPEYAKAKAQTAANPTDDKTKPIAIEDQPAVSQEQRAAASANPPPKPESRALQF
ncbi:MAG: DnaJ domain-containing protein [Coxiellaceae bacterium]|nr:DnaJ domain-containing protein [Coxiellaceae bacterium]